ncbi:hypothetical protein ACX0G9_25070 [Flavitalea flava]
MLQNYDTLFSRAMMTGLFIGIVDTIICLSYNIGFRGMIKGYLPSTLINVSSLIFGVNLLLLVTGMVYVLFVKAFGRKDFIFSGFFLVLTMFCVWQTLTVLRYTDLTENREFKELLIGIVLILGISASALPYFLRSRFFDKYIL